MIAMQKPTRFDYQACGPHAGELQEAAATIRKMERQASNNIVRIGELLLVARQRLKKRDFQRWLLLECSISTAMASRYMRVATRFEGRTDCVANIRQHALCLLAAPATPPDVFDELVGRAEAGETIRGIDVQERLQALKPSQHAAPAHRVWRVQSALTTLLRDEPAENRLEVAKRVFLQALAHALKKLGDEQGSRQLERGGLDLDDCLADLRAAGVLVES